jgi:hypothetical protein
MSEGSHQAKIAVRASCSANSTVPNVYNRIASYGIFTQATRPVFRHAAGSTS